MSNQPVVFVSRRIPDVGIDRLENECEVHVWEGDLPPSHEAIVERLSELEANGLLCLLTDDIDAEVMDASDELSVISTYSVGYDHIELDSAIDRELQVGHTPGVLSETTADFTWTLLTACARRIVEGHRYVERDEWETWHPTLLRGPDIHDATLGVIGLGDIGTAVARRTAGFDMSVLYTARSRKEDREEELTSMGIDVEYVSLDDLLSSSDFVTLHVPLTEETEELIGTPELNQMKEEAILINTSRGAVVDTTALEHALEEGSILRCGLDVTDPEPLPGDHSLLEHAPQKVVIAPHLGSASTQTRGKMAEMAAENVLAGLQGEALPHSAIHDARQ